MKILKKDVEKKDTNNTQADTASGVEGEWEVLELDQYLWKCVKEHTILQSEIFHCYHGDFMTYDLDTHVNHVVANHSTKHTCILREHVEKCFQLKQS